MEQTIDEFFHDFRQKTLAGAEANSTYQLETFMETVSNELVETGFVEGFEHCHYRAPRGMRVDGYWFNDEDALDIFVADFDCRRQLETLTRTDVDASFRRVVNFFEAKPPRIARTRRNHARIRACSADCRPPGHAAADQLFPYLRTGAQRPLSGISRP